MNLQPGAMSIVLTLDSDERGVIVASGLELQALFACLQAHLANPSDPQALARLKEQWDLIHGQTPSVRLSA